MKKEHIIVILITIVVIIIAGFGGWYLAKKGMNNTKVIDGIVVNVKANVDYSAKLIKTYKEYEKILEDNAISLNDENVLKEKDFKKNDYIVDYIPYDKDLKITGEINVEVLEGGTVITDFTLANRVFNYENE